MATNKFKFFSIRNITSPSDKEGGRSVYVGHFPISSVCNLSNNENVRSYLVDAEGKKRKMPSQVHLAIRETLKDKPSDFSVLNGGIVIVAKNCNIDEKNSCIELTEPSIINGSQTQGEIKNFIKTYGEEVAAEIYVKFEIIISSDEDLIADISIARNFQNDVQALSISGRKGELDELERNLKKHHPQLSLQKSESTRISNTNSLISTEKLLQVIAALLPKELWWKSGDINKTYTYNAKATCLKDFRRIFEAAQKGDKNFIKVYQFYLDIAGPAWSLYTKWKTHQGFQGTGLRSIERDGREIIDVPDGIIFPIIVALSQFVSEKGNAWQINKPNELDDRELINTAKTIYIEIARSKPELMGKTKACYSGLEQITSIYKRLLESRK